ATVVVSGRYLRLASIHEEEWLEHEIQDPGLFISTLKDRKPGTFRSDIFTFAQKLPHTEPKYAYPIELDNVASLSVSTFSYWWTQQIDNKTRNMVRKAEKKAVVTREVPFNDALVQGISDIYNETPVRQGRAFWHYGKDLDSVARENASFLERSIFIGS